MSDSPMPRICGSTYPVSYHLLEYYLAEQGFTAVSWGTKGDCISTDIYAVWAKGSHSAEIHRSVVYDRPKVRALLNLVGLLLDDFEDFVSKIKLDDDRFNLITDAGINKDGATHK